MRYSSIAAVVVSLLLTSASSAAPIQLLQNRSFENNNHLRFWTVNGVFFDNPAPANPGPINAATYADDFHAPGSPTSVPAPGDWGLQIEQRGGTVGAFKEANAQQTVPIGTPGWYTINSSVWARVFDNGGGLSRARFRIRIDGVNQPFQVLTSAGQPAGWTPQNAWSQLSYTPGVPVFVNSDLTAFIEMRADGTGNVDFWGQVVADVFTLEVDLVNSAPTVTDAEYLNVNASVPGLFEHQFDATDAETPGGPFTWDNLEFLGYTPAYGGVGSGPANAATLSSSGEFEWNSVSSPRGIYEWRVRTTDAGGSMAMTDTGTIKIHVREVPEPTLLTLFGLAATCMAGLRRRW